MTIDLRDRLETSFGDGPAHRTIDERLASSSLGAAVRILHVLLGVGGLSDPMTRATAAATLLR